MQSPAPGKTIDIALSDGTCVRLEHTSASWTEHGGLRLLHLDGTGACLGAVEVPDRDLADVIRAMIATIGGHEPMVRSYMPSPSPMSSTQAWVSRR